MYIATDSFIPTLPTPCMYQIHTVLLLYLQLDCTVLIAHLSCSFALSITYLCCLMFMYPVPVLWLYLVCTVPVLCLYLVCTVPVLCLYLVCTVPVLCFYCSDTLWYLSCAMPRHFCATHSFPVRHLSIISALSIHLLFLPQICEADQKFNQLVHLLKRHKTSKQLVFFSTCASVEYFGKALQRWQQLH